MNTLRNDEEIHGTGYRISSFLKGLMAGGLVALLMPAVILSVWTLRAQPSLDRSSVAFFALCFTIPAAGFILLGLAFRAAVRPRTAYPCHLFLGAAAVVLALLFPHYLRLIDFAAELIGVQSEILGPAGMLVLVFGVANGWAAAVIACGVARTGSAKPDAVRSENDEGREST